MALQHPAAEEGCKFTTQTTLRQFDPLWITLFRHGCGSSDGLNISGRPHLELYRPAIRGLPQTTPIALLCVGLFFKIFVTPWVGDHPPTSAARMDLAFCNLCCRSHFAGGKYMPCLLRNATSQQDAGIMGQGQTFPLDVLESGDPPTIAHFTQRKALDVQLRSASRIFHVQWSEIDSNAVSVRVSPTGAKPFQSSKK
jgi:hypothetical protein